MQTTTNVAVRNGLSFGEITSMGKRMAWFMNAWFGFKVINIKYFHFNFYQIQIMVRFEIEKWFSSILLNVWLSTKNEIK